MVKILLVDDDKATNFYNKFLLKKNKVDCEVIIQVNGLNALEYLKNEAIPDFIFLDINMPVMDGIQFLEEAQNWSNGNLDKTKVYIMMSVTLSEDRLQKLQEIKNIEIIKRKVLTNEDIDKLFKTKSS